MIDLSIADRMHVHAADCWISVGDLNHARTELEEIPPALRAHPNVLQVRWHVCALARQWEMCVEIATSLTEMNPERPFGWIHLATSLRRLGKHQEAIQVLRNGTKELGETPALLLSLACCYARLGKLSRAGKCLNRAFGLAEDQQARDKLLFRAFDEPDLEPVWQADGGSLAGYHQVACG